MTAEAWAPRHDQPRLTLAFGGVPKLNLQRPEIAYVLGLRADPTDKSQEGLKAVDALIASGAFPAFKIGGTRVARFEDVKAYNDKLAAQLGSSGENEESAGSAPPP